MYLFVEINPFSYPKPRTLPKYFGSGGVGVTYFDVCAIMLKTVEPWSGKDFVFRTLLVQWLEVCRNGLVWGS